MEAALKDLQEWINSLPVIEPKYYAEYDPQTGKILSVCPDYAAEQIQNKIEVDKEIVESILEGRTGLNSYVVDFTTANIEFVEIQLLHKIDDVLHRIIDKRWSSVEDPDVILKYNRSKKELSLELARKYKDNTRKIHWDGSTDMVFLITDYNDPNIPIYNFSVKINEIIKNNCFINIDLPKNFSVYTRRIFKNYIIEEL